MTIDLKKEFNKVADEFRDAYLCDTPSCIDLDDDNTVVPLFNEHGWAMNISRNNCYNFAIDYWGNNFMMPGEFLINSLPLKDKAKLLHEWREDFRKDKSAEEYADIIIERAEGDGLDYLGLSPKKLDDSFPVALFIRKGTQPYLTDFHWFSLRRRANTAFAEPMGWFHKLGVGPAEDCGKQTIFHSARQDQYNYFAGYFAVNKKKMGIPDDPFDKENFRRSVMKRHSPYER